MLIRPTENQKPADISKVIDLALVYNPMLAAADLSTIRMWVNEGCCIESDILPTLREMMKRKKGITRFHYFTNPILEARDKRQIQASQEAHHEAKSDEYYANIYRWKRDKGMSLTVEQETMLRKFEAKENPHQRELAGACMVSDEVSVQMI
jgi:hypothetical protein